MGLLFKQSQNISPSMKNFKKRYEFDPNKDLIGKGGFSKVYRAFDKHRNRVVALKFYYGVWSEKYDIISEINRMENIVHPNLVRYYDATIVEAVNAFGENEQLQVGIMEYADAGDITAIYRLKDKKIFESIIIDILKGLSHLHDHGIAHRDLKPKNILLTRNEKGKLTAKIADFGISKNVDKEDTGASTQLLGSVEYMSPEQFNTKKYGIDNKLHTNVDLWALGVIIYEMLAHQTPFGNRATGFSNEQILNNILFADVKIDYSKLEEPFLAVVKKCLVKHAADRAKFADDLLRIIQEQYNATAKKPLEVSAPNRPTPQITSQPTEEITNKINTEPTSQDTVILPNNINREAPKKPEPPKIIPPTPPNITPAPEPKTKSNNNTGNPYIGYVPPVQKTNGNNGRFNSTLEEGKKYFRQKDFINSFRYINSVGENLLDTETKFYKGFMLYNGKCGGAHDAVSGKRLMDEAKAEDHALVVELMVKYILNDY